jgi:TRAP-type C4-dicarboxylate transport system substrate-binding protein
MTRLTQIYLVIFSLANLVIIPTASGNEKIKLATLAPKNSSWMKIFYAMGKEIQEKSGSKVKIQFFPDGVQGDEIDVIRKMRAGLLHAGAMTEVGLGEIHKPVLIFQTFRLFNNYAELDYVRDQLRDGLEKAFDEAGYVLLGWGDIGYYYIFSNHPIKTIEDLRNRSVKVWVRTGDPVSEHFYKTVDFIGVPVSVPQVLLSLQTGQINALIVSPLACVALQWYPKLKYMSDMPIRIGIGATLITKERYTQLPAEEQMILRDTARQYHQKLIQRVRNDNDKSVEALTKKAGMQIVTISDSERERWNTRCAQMRDELAGEIYPPSLLQQVNALLDAYRSTHPQD